MPSTNLNWQWEDMPFLVASKHHPTQNWCGCSTAMIGCDRLPRDKREQIGTIIILANFRGVQCRDHPQWHYPCPHRSFQPRRRQLQGWTAPWQPKKSNLKERVKVRPCAEKPAYQGLQHHQSLDVIGGLHARVKEHGADWSWHVR